MTIYICNTNGCKHPETRYGNLNSINAHLQYDYHPAPSIRQYRKVETGSRGIEVDSKTVIYSGENSANQVKDPKEQNPQFSSTNRVTTDPKEQNPSVLSPTQARIDEFNNQYPNVSNQVRWDVVSAIKSGNSSTFGDLVTFFTPKPAGGGGGQPTLQPAIPVDTRTIEEKEAAFYGALDDALKQAATGNPEKLRNFDRWFGIARPEAEYSADFYTQQPIATPATPATPATNNPAPENNPSDTLNTSTLVGSNNQPMYSGGTPNFNESTGEYVNGHKPPTKSNFNMNSLMRRNRGNAWWKNRHGTTDNSDTVVAAAPASSLVDQSTLDPNSDEAKYLRIRMTQASDDKTMSNGLSTDRNAHFVTKLANSWSNYKAANDYLKANGYDYYDMSSVYGKSLSGEPGASTRIGEWKYIEGPKGKIEGEYSAKLDGEIVNPKLNPNSSQYDKALDKKLKVYMTIANVGYDQIVNVSAQIAANQELEELSASLTAKGVDLVKLEQDYLYSGKFSSTNASGMVSSQTSTEDDVADRPDDQTKRRSKDRDNIWKKSGVTDEDGIIATAAQVSSNMFPNAKDPEPKPLTAAEIDANVAEWKTIVKNSTTHTWDMENGPLAGKKITVYRSDNTSINPNLATVDDLDPEYLAMGINKFKTHHIQDSYGANRSKGMSWFGGQWVNIGNTQRIAEEFKDAYGTWDEFKGQYVKTDAAGNVTPTPASSIDKYVREVASHGPFQDQYEQSLKSIVSLESLAAEVSATNSSIDPRIAEINASSANQAAKDKALKEVSSGNASSAKDLVTWFQAGGPQSQAVTNLEKVAEIYNSGDSVKISNWEKFVAANGGGAATDPSGASPAVPPSTTTFTDPNTPKS